MVYFSAMVNEESKSKVDVLAVMPGFVNTQLVDFRRQTFDKISVDTCVSGILKDLGQNHQTNTCFIHEFFTSFMEQLWYINNELKVNWANSMDKSSKMLDDFMAKREQVKKERNKMK